jgi:glycine betaine catabolism B
LTYTIDEEDGGTPWIGEKGRINKEILNKHLNDEANHSIFYVCGPPPMLKAMKSLLEIELKITKDRIKIEEFTGY